MPDMMLKASLNNAVSSKELRERALGYFFFETMIQVSLALTDRKHMLLVPCSNALYRIGAPHSRLL